MVIPVKVGEGDDVDISVLSSLLVQRQIEITLYRNGILEKLVMEMP